MATAALRNVVLTAMAETLRPVGFRKSRSTFTRTLPEVVHLVNLQSSQSSTAVSLRTTVNLAVWVPALAGVAARPDVWSAHWRERLGFLMPSHDDKWWQITSEHDADLAGAEISGAIRTLGLPTLDGLATRSSLKRLWQAGRGGCTRGQAADYLARLARLPELD